MIKFRIFILCLAFSATAQAQWAPQWQLPRWSQYVISTNARAAVNERCGAVSVTPDWGAWTNANLMMDVVTAWLGVGEKLALVKANLAAAVPHYIQLDYLTYLAPEGSFTNWMYDTTNVLVAAGAPEGWFTNTPYFLRGTDENGWKYVPAIVSQLQWTVATPHWTNVVALAGANSATNYRQPPYLGSPDDGGVMYVAYAWDYYGINHEIATNPPIKPNWICVGGTWPDYSAGLAMGATVSANPKPRYDAYNALDELHRELWWAAAAPVEGGRPFGGGWGNGDGWPCTSMYFSATSLTNWDSVSGTKETVDSMLDVPPMTPGVLEAMYQIHSDPTDGGMSWADHGWQYGSTISDRLYPVAPMDYQMTINVRATTNYQVWYWDWHLGSGGTRAGYWEYGNGSKTWHSEVSEGPAAVRRDFKF